MQFFSAILLPSLTNNQTVSYRGICMMTHNYDLALMATNISFPTSIAFDDAGTLYVAESGLPFGGAAPGGRILRILEDGSHEVLVKDLRQPVNGLTAYQESLYISEGGFSGGSGRISRLDP